MVERRKKRRRKRERVEKEKEEEECGRGRGARRNVRLAVQPTTEATSAGEGIPEIPVPVREWGAGGGLRERRVGKVEVCADGGAAGDGGWLMVVVVEASEQAGGQAGWMTREGQGGS